jgi:hypothetical protein
LNFTVFTFPIATHVDKKKRIECTQKNKVEAKIKIKRAASIEEFAIRRVERRVSKKIKRFFDRKIFFFKLKSTIKSALDQYFIK